MEFERFFTAIWMIYYMSPDSLYLISISLTIEFDLEIVSQSLGLIVDLIVD